MQHALFHTLPGRAIVIGLIARITVSIVGITLGSVPPFLSIVDTVAGVALAVGAVYFVFRLVVVAKRRLLWRVRRKLVLSYIFIGFIPVILIASFFLLCGFLLFYNFSSYLVQSRLNALSEQARFFARSAALEIQRGGGRDVADIIARRQRTAAAEFDGASFAVVPMNRACADTSKTQTTASANATPIIAGAWAHVDPPTTVPPWIDCPGFAGVLAYTTPAASSRGEDQTHLLVRAAAFPDSARPGYAVVVDVPFAAQAIERLQGMAGVEARKAIPAPVSGVTPIRGRSAATQTAAPASAGLMSNLPTVVEYRDWNSGADTGRLLVSMQVSIGQLYDRISSAQGLNFGQGLLLALSVVGALFLIIEFFALVAGLALAKSITGSVHELFTGTERVRQGDFTHKIAVHTEDQLGELAGSFNSMTASIEDLLRQAAEKKRLEEELRIAREIQMSLLPHGPVAMPGLSLTALCIPAREVGGDYYDFFRLGDRRLGVLIADVSGKGTSAALYMAELKGLMLSLSQIHSSPRALMLAANRIMAATLNPGSFITMTYAVVDLDARTLTYARAGHTPLIYVPSAASAPGRQAQVFAPDGLVLGLNIDDGEMFERLLEEKTIPLHVGDLAVFFTDGISEAMNEADDCFGEGRLGRIAEEHAHLPSEELRERVLREVEAFVGTAPQHDDMTMILLKIDEVPAAAPMTAQLAQFVRS